MKFRPSNKLNGFYYILDEDNNKVGIRKQDGILRPKRFKTEKKAIQFAARLQFVSE